MIELECDGSGPLNIDIAPSNIRDEIFQNIRTILTTMKGSVPLDREFGIDAVLLDSPSPVARARLSSEIVSLLKRYEPRIEVTKVAFTENSEGRLTPKVTVAIYEQTP